MSFQDVFKSSFMESVTEFSAVDTLIGMLFALVIGLFIFVVYPFFKALAQSGHVMVIAWIYVFTLIIVITFAIEIGQKITHTGNMDFADIVFGIFGFLVMFFLFSLVRGVYHGIKKLYRIRKKRNREEY